MIKDGFELQTFINTLSEVNAKIFKLQVRERCRITPQQLYSWRHGKVKIPYLAKKEIESIAGTKVFSEM